MKQVYLGKVGNTMIAIFILGNVDKNFIDFVIDTLSYFYRSIEGGPEFVEIYVYGSRIEKLTYLEIEARDLGIVAIGDFITLHEAWRGYPRIHISLEELTNIPSDVVRTLLIHEAAHSVLHGSLQYYIVSITNKELLARIDREELLRAMYMVSTAVKDLEVAYYLMSINLLNECIIYGKYVVKQLKDLECSQDLLTLAHISKLLAPLIPLDEVSRNRILKEYIASKPECKNIIEKLMSILERTKGLSSRDLSLKVNFVLRELLNILKR